MVMMILALLCATTLVPQGDVLFDTLKATAYVFESVEEQEMIREIKRVMFEELQERYGDGNFEILKVVKQENGYGLEFEIKTSYLDNTFKVLAGKVRRYGR